MMHMEENEKEEELLDNEPLVGQISLDELLSELRI